MCILPTPKIAAPPPPAPLPPVEEPPPPVPENIGEQVTRRAEDERTIAARSRGRSNTILSGGLGLTTPASTAPRSLLGI